MKLILVKPILILPAILSLRAWLRVQSRNSLSTKAAGLSDKSLATERENVL